MTWENCDDFQHEFPYFHLEDKVVLEEESNIRPPIILHYSSRGKKKRKARVIGSVSDIGAHSHLGGNGRFK